MDIFAYICIFGGIFVLWAFGRLIVRVSNYASFLAGLVVAGSTLSVTARFIPSLSREIMLLFCTAGLLRLVYDIYRKKIVFTFHPIFFLAAFFFTIYLRHLHIANWIFESHDVLYFAPAMELLNADYLGNIRVPYYYPNEMTANHLVPAGCMAALGFLYPTPNLAFFIESRYILVVFSFASLFSTLWKNTRANAWRFVITSLFLLIIFGEEITYNVTISSFIYVFIILQIVKMLLNGEGAPKHELLFFSIMLIICKAPIFYIAAVMAIYLWVTIKSARFHPIIFIAGLMVLANMATWVLIPAPDEDTAFGILNLFDSKSLASFFEIAAWTLQDNFQIYIAPRTSMPRPNLEGVAYLIRLLVTFVSMFILLLYLVMKYYVPVFLCGYCMMKKEARISLFVYMSISLLGWLFVRNNGTLMHQAHAYLLASLVSFIALIQLSCWKRYVFFGVIATGILFAVGHNPSRIPSRHVVEGRKKTATAVGCADVVIQKGDNGFYVPPAGEPYYKTEINSMVSGLRIRSEDVLLLTQRPTYPFILTTEPIFKLNKMSLDFLIESGASLCDVENASKYLGSIVIGERKWKQYIMDTFGIQLTPELISKFTAISKLD